MRKRSIGLGNRVLLIVVSLCGLIVVGATAVLILADRENVIQEAEQRNSVLTQVLEEHARRAFDLSKISLEDLGRDILINGRPTATPEMSARMAQWLSTNPLIASYWLINDTGTVVHTTQRVNTTGIDFSDREYFKAHAAGEDIHVGKMTLGRLDGMWFFSLSKRLTDQTGAFRGILLASMRTDYFSSLYARLGLGPTDNIGIYRADGSLVARRLQDWDGPVAPSNATSPLFSTHLSKSPSGVYRSTSPIDGIERIIAYRSLDGWPLIVASGTSIDSVIGEWRARSYRNAAYGGALLLLLAVMGVCGSRALARQRVLEEATLRATEEARHEAERASAAKSRFLAATSHDLRQPVQSLFFMLAALEGRVAPAAEKTLAHATEALAALKSLLDSLLDISQLDAGTVKFDIREFALSTLLDQISAEYKLLAAAKGLDWHVIGCTATVRSDPALLGRMLRNLCQNAIRYTETGSVLVRCRASEGTVQIEVEDTGIGIPADKQDAIFEEFHQIANDHRDRKQGLGLGLAIVQRLSKLLDHAVEVRSTPGRGSTFTVTVPMTVAPGVRRVEAEVIPIAHGGGEFVVVIEDEELVRLGVKTLIESWGYAVFDAASGPHALAALQGSQRVPHIIVSDYRLPKGKNGIDVIHDIRALFNTAIPAILLTGETSRQGIEAAVAENISVIHKPVSPSQLHAALSVKVAKANEVGLGMEA